MNQLDSTMVTAVMEHVTVLISTQACLSLGDSIKPRVIVDAVVEYHSLVLRPYKIYVSNKRRFKVICKVSSCPFVVRFGFSSSFKGPTHAISHTCPMDPASKGARNKWTAKNLANNLEV